MENEIEDNIKKDKIKDGLYKSRDKKKVDYFMEELKDDKKNKFDRKRKKKDTLNIDELIDNEMDMM